MSVLPFAGFFKRSCLKVILTNSQGQSVTRSFSVGVVGKRLTQISLTIVPFETTYLTFDLQVSQFQYFSAFLVIGKFDDIVSVHFYPFLSKPSRLSSSHSEIKTE